MTSMATQGQYLRGAPAQEHDGQYWQRGAPYLANEVQPTFGAPRTGAAALASKRPGTTVVGHSKIADGLVRDTVNNDAIVTDAPGERYRLGFVDVACLIINRMIGEVSFSHSP